MVSHKTFDNLCWVWQSTWRMCHQVIQPFQDISHTHTQHKFIGLQWELCGANLIDWCPSISFYEHISDKWQLATRIPDIGLTNNDKTVSIFLVQPFLFISFFLHLFLSSFIPFSTVMFIGLINWKWMSLSEFVCYWIHLNVWWEQMCFRSVNN